MELAPKFITDWQHSTRKHDLVLVLTRTAEYLTVREALRLLSLKAS
jgi:hypothetical protein